MNATTTSKPPPRGYFLLRDARRNKSTAFSASERVEYGLVGLLPPAVETIERQIERCMMQLDRKPTDLERYVYLTTLLDTDEVLFYKVLWSDPARFLPIIYAPTVGQACQEFGHIYRRPRGMYVSIDQRGNVKSVLRNWPVHDVRVICVSTGGRILGLGDLGANGMGIPIGKLLLYVACAGVPPIGLLPLLLDCGTDNEKLLSDPLYLGLRRRRPSTAELDEFIEEFIEAVQEVFPLCCIHFEDWNGADAIRLLDRYRDRVSCFNDDIQGTGSVVVAGLYNAAKLAGRSLTDQRILIAGAGSAGIGIANMIVAAMRLDGLSEGDARKRISLYDKDGLIEPSRPEITPAQLPFAHPHAPTPDLLTAVRSLQPTTLLGVSTIGGLFTRQVIELMGTINPRPIIFAMSNPTDHAECSAVEALRWTNGRAIFAAGVPFPPVEIDGQERLSGQANNFYIFPAVGLAIYATAAKRVPDSLFITAARALADQVTPEQLKQGMLYPPQQDILRVEQATAAVVAERIFDMGLARVERPANIPDWLASLSYEPTYKYA